MKLSDAKLMQGDVLGIRQKTLFGSVTTLAQKLGGFGDLSGINHVGVARKIDEVWYSQEMDGKHNVLRPISQIIQKGWGIEVFRSGVVVTDNVLNKYLAKPIAYNLIDLIKIGFHLIFRFQNNGSEDDGNMVCSGYAGEILKESGWIGKLYNMPSPCEVCRALGNPIYQIDGE